MTKTKKALFFILFVLVLAQAASALDNLYVTAKYSKKGTCPCTPIVFEFEIKNKASYLEIYSVGVDKEFREWNKYIDFFR